MKRSMLRRWGLVAGAVLLGCGSSVWAQAPMAEPEIEVYVGTVKVAPIPPPPAPIIIVQEAPKPEPKPEPKDEPKPRVEAPVFVPIIPAGAWSASVGPQPLPGHIANPSDKLTPQGNTIFHLMSHLMTKLVLGTVPREDRTQPISAPHIVIIREPAPEAKPPAYVPPPVAPTPAPAPQIVVVREPAPEPKPVVEAPSGLRVTWEVVGLFGCSVLGLLGLVAVLGRTFKSSHRPVAEPTLAAASHDPEKDGPLLAGKYRTGPLPESAERFDIGPSYHEEKQAQERAVEAGKQAVVANILMQNLELFDGDEPQSEPTAQA